jgi:hypothetical protein
LATDIFTLFIMTLADVAPALDLAPATETGALGIYQLKRLWSRAMGGRAGRFWPTTLHDRHLDDLVIHASGLGLEQTASFLGQEAWWNRARRCWMLPISPAGRSTAMWCSMTL